MLTHEDNINLALNARFILSSRVNNIITLYQPSYHLIFV